MEFHERLFDLRKKAGYSQDELAQRCNVTRQSVSKWESGNVYPEIDKMMLLAELFDVSVDYLLGRSEEVKQVITIEVPSKQEFEYISKWHIGTLPLVHIHFHYSRGLRFGIGGTHKKCRAVGVIAMGNTAIGVFALGFRSIGLCSIGLLSLGLLSLGMISLGGLAIGIISLGYLAFGVISIGMYALGVVAIASHIGAGVVTVAHDAIGVIANGVNVFHDTHSSGQECVVAMNGTPVYEEWLSQTSMPGLFRFILSWFHTCV